jgi:nitroreductase
MELIEALLSRRSIRKYSDKKIEKEKIDIILKAAMYAPSAMNYQPWEFIVMDDKKLFAEMLGIITHAEMLKESTLAILVCGDLSKEKYEEYNAQNCSAATQNILLAAHDLGLGAVWIAAYPNKEVIQKIKKLLNLPENILPVSLISMGYPAEEKTAEERFIKEKIHFNGW